MVELEKQTINTCLENPTLSKNLSFSLQREEILKRYPDAIFPKENHSLEEYLFRILYDLGYQFANSRYIRPSVMYLYEQENPYLISVTKELYPIISKRMHKAATAPEREIRGCINRAFPSILKNLKQEIFATSENDLTTNSMFLLNLTEYAQAHYYNPMDISNITEEQRASFLEQIKPENNALEILKKAKLKQEVERFLINKFGHFIFKETKSQQAMVDYILYALEHKLDARGDLYNILELRKKWEIENTDDFFNQMQGISHAIDKVYEIGNYDVATYKEIFGDLERHRIPIEYITKIGDYLNNQDFIRELKR